MSSERGYPSSWFQLAKVWLTSSEGYPVAHDVTPCRAYSNSAARNAAGCSPPAFIARYEYKGNIVYFVPQRCCDVMSVVYRSDGTVICQAAGGIAVTGDGRCPDFFAERRNEFIIWRDPLAFHSSNPAANVLYVSDPYRFRSHTKVSANTIV